MNSRSAIFTVILVLLVPLGYSSFATNEACALPKMLGSEKCTYTNYLKTEKTCCYLVTGGDIADGSLRPGQLAERYCEDCKKNYKGEWVCEKPYKANEGSLPDDPQDSLDVKPTQPTEPKVPRGDILPDDGEPTINDPPTTTEPKVPGHILPDDGEPTINDPPTTTEPKVLEPGKIEIPNLK